MLYLSNPMESRAVADKREDLFSDPRQGEEDAEGFL
jgi:hypothetical protein